MNAASIDILGESPLARPFTAHMSYLSAKRVSAPFEMRIRSQSVMELCEETMPDKQQRQHNICDSNEQPQSLACFTEKQQVSLLLK
jgi:hypothetical protein